MKFFGFLLSVVVSGVVAAQGVPRPEHPRPDMVRQDWASLNGTWDFAESDNSDEMWSDRNDFPDKIVVPFCRESKLSGLARKGFVKNVWYRRTFVRPMRWKSKRTLLHLGGSDWRTRVWVNGKVVGDHTGGQSPMDFDVTDVLNGGTNTLVVHSFDDTRSGLQALGKQCPEADSYGCLYTRTTGIWQSVWLEGVGETYLTGLLVKKADPRTGRLVMDVFASEKGDGLSVQVEAAHGGKPGFAQAFPVKGGKCQVDMIVPKIKPWAPGSPNLYDVTLSLRHSSGREQKPATLDTLKTYVGFRDIRIQGRAILINGRPVFQRLVLDQGFYPDGIWTAPSDAALKHDIDLSMAAGFNGARLHQKVFEPRFLYWADKMGYLVWGEYPNWGLNYKDKRVDGPVLDEWREIVARDYNHPSIVGWCPFNETPAEAGPLQDKVVAATRELDPSRPVIDTSGYVHSVKNPMVMDAHDYDQDPASFKARYEKAFGNAALPERYGSLVPANVPFMVSEYGGIGWDTEGGWGYGNGPKTLDEFYTRFKGLTDALLDNPNMFGFCYTQLTDVEQEHNGVCYYDRRPKFDMKRLHSILGKKAAIEMGTPTKGTVSAKPWTVLVGSSRDGGRLPWHYTESRPSELWLRPGFDFGTWPSGLGGFGLKGGFEADIKTPWSTPDIWLVQDFVGAGFKEALLVLHFDNAAEVYVNGREIWKSKPGAWNDGYDGFDVTQKLKSAMVQGQNRIAVHCHQDTGGQFIDLALLVRR